MSDDQYAQYREYLHQGTRIEVGIPLSGGGVFRDWAIIQESAGDELVAQISRDVLPANVRVDEGFILDVSTWIKQDVYTCSGIVTEKVADGRVLRIRLFGDFTLRERRQFFRSYLSLRVRYALIDDGNRDHIQEDWEQRKNLEHMKFQGYDDTVIAGQRARYVPMIKLEWQDMAPGEVNLGGGGLRHRLPQPVQPEQLLALEIHLPLSPPRLVHAVAQVIHVMAPRVQRGVTTYQAGMQFLFLDERDRDLIFRHISVTQIEYLRRIAEKREPIGLEPSGGREPVQSRQTLRKVVWGLVILALAVYLVWFLIQYQKQAPPNEIGETYEKAIRQYRHQEK